MKQVGYIENGILHTKRIEPQTITRDGMTTTITEEEQIAQLSTEWKEVDAIDATQLNAAAGYHVRITPYDAGDKISYKYETVFDAQARKNEIATLKAELDGSDYKVAKCYEASLLGETLPYDIGVLHAERQAIRDKINALEEELLNKG